MCGFHSLFKARRVEGGGVLWGSGESQQVVYLMDVNAAVRGECTVDRSSAPQYMGFTV